jgi:hypothetical protein
MGIEKAIEISYFPLNNNDKKKSDLFNEFMYFKGKDEIIGHVCAINCNKILVINLTYNLKDGKFYSHEWEEAMIVDRSSIKEDGYGHLTTNEGMVVTQELEYKTYEELNIPMFMLEMDIMCYAQNSP